MRLDLIGGYGEHGRNCFLVHFDHHPFILLDCGIMDTDENPNPQLNREVIGNIDYLFVTHCHKDHVGAFQYLVDNGFHGLLITTEMTYQLAKLSYPKVSFLNMNESKMMISDIEIRYGRSGHCPGSIWLKLICGKETLLYSGDYQADSYLYVTDQIKGDDSVTAIVDLAHEGVQEEAATLRAEMINEIENLLNIGKKVILPVQKYGRGLDMLALLSDTFKEHCSITIDETFYKCAMEMLKEDFWYKKKIEVDKSMIGNTGDIWFIADTHLEKEKNQIEVQHYLDENGVLFLSGRLKKGSFTKKHYDCHENTIMLKYPHHQSEADFEKMISLNHFETIYPFHNNHKRIISYLNENEG